ncbi:MAG: response regulator transcription factor [Anaerolineales bacterium]|nr:MAG: response regulator transcription factor [Anaerolineales bacterium]
MTMITLVIVDDRPAVRQGLQMRLALEEDMQVVGEAQNGRDALSAIPHLKPIVVLMDMEMPEMDGLAAIQTLRSIAPESKVVVLTIHDDETSRRRAYESGAAGFVCKCAGDEALLNVIRAVVHPAS